MPRESVLTHQERASITIDRFIFHILDSGEDEPIYLEAVVLEESQKAFFRQRIADAAEGTQYVFLDQGDATPVSCRRILDGSDATFLEESKRLAREFLGHHMGRATSNGAFIVAAIHLEHAGQHVPLIAMLKMDHQRVLSIVTSQDERGLVARMQEVLNTFVEAKAALQKAALIDVGDGYVWDALAWERRSDDDVADYFKNFLGVTPREDPSHWTREAVRAVTRWARASSERLPEGDDLFSIKARAIKYMETHDTFTTEGFLDMVVRSPDADERFALRASLATELAEAGIAGQEFAPQPGSLKAKDVRNRLTTEEGVIIEWSGDPAANGISIRNKPGGGMTIVVESQGVRARN